MATRTVLTDDLDEQIDTDVRTVTFGHEGATFEIDLGAKNREELEAALSKYLDKARAVGRRAATPGGGARPTRSRPVAASGLNTDAVREWARANGHTVSDKGRIANSVVEAYKQANPGA